MNDRTKTMPLDRFRPGQPVSARHHNQGVDALTEMRRGVRPPRQVTRARGGEAEAAPALALKVVYYHSAISSVAGNYLRCVETPDLLTEGTPSPSINVALPYMLRSWPWGVLGRPWLDTLLPNWPLWSYTYHHVQTRAATRTSDGLVEEQAITPSYTPGDPLLILKAPMATWLSDNPRGIQWLDMNVDGRAWARVASE